MDILTVLRSLGSVAVILVLVGLGIFVDKRNWFPGESWRGLGSLVVNIAMPCSAFYYIASPTDGFTRQSLAEAGLGMLAYGVMMLVIWLLALGGAAVFKMDKNRRGTFAAMAAFSNTVFIGLPMTAMLFGDGAVKYAFMAFLPNTLLFWTVGVFAIRRDGEPGASFFSKGWYKRLLNPALAATLLGLILVLLDIKPPTLLLQGVRTVSGMVSPVALIFCGILLSRMGLKNLRIKTSQFAVMFFRFAASPVITYLVLTAVGAGDMMTRVLIAQASMPVMSQTTIIAGLYRADADYAATGFMLTTVASVVAMPVIMALMDLVM